MAEEFKTSEAHRRAVHKNRQLNNKRYSFELSKNTDADMIEYLDSVDNRAGTIKAAIREKMEREDNGRHTD